MINQSKSFVSHMLDFLFQSIHTLLDPVTHGCLFVRPSRHGDMSSPSPFSSQLPVFFLNFKQFKQVILEVYEIALLFHSNICVMGYLRFSEYSRSTILFCAQTDFVNV